MGAGARIGTLGWLIAACLAGCNAEPDQDAWVDALPCEDLHTELDDWAVSVSACASDDECAIFTYEDTAGCDCRTYLGDPQGVPMRVDALDTAARFTKVYRRCDVQSGVCDMTSYARAVCVDGVCRGVDEGCK